MGIASGVGVSCEEGSLGSGRYIRVWALKSEAFL